MAAQVIVAVADHHQHAAQVRFGIANGRSKLEQLLAALIDRVVKRRAAAGALLRYDVPEVVEIARECLNHFRLIVDGHQKGLVLVPPDHVIEEIDGRLLLELQPVADAVGGIQQQPHSQRQVGLPVEKAYLLLRVVVENPKILLIQIRHNFVLLVENGKQDVHQAHILANGRRAIGFGRGRRRWRLLRLLRLLRGQSHRKHHGRGKDCEGSTNAHCRNYR